MGENEKIKTGEGKGLAWLGRGVGEIGMVMKQRMDTELKIILCSSAVAA